MAAVTPSSDLYLLQCPIEIDNKNQINFANATTQYNYFFGLNKIGATNFSYQRKDSTIRYPAHIDSIRHYNYCMYRNDNYSNKWFYAFIEEMEYLNDSTTLIKIKTDTFQTWQFDLTFKRCFVEREHVNDDTIGKHTLDEGLSVGEYFINGSINMPIANSISDQQRIVAQVTQLPDGVDAPADTSTRSYRVYNGIPQGCYFVVFDGATSRNKFVKWYDKKGQAGAIVSMFLVPPILVASAEYNNYTIGEGIGSTRVGFLDASWGATTLYPPTIYYSATLDGYTPKNKKLYCSPFSYLEVSNNAGSNAIYHFEDFRDPTNPKFACKAALSQGCAIRLYPQDYKAYGGEDLYDYGINAPKLPVLSWASDYYLNWQALNGQNNELHMEMGIVSGIGQIAGGAADIYNNNTGTGITNMVSGGMAVEDAIVDAMHERHLAEATPSQAKGNINVADLGYSMGRCAFTFRIVSCRKEYCMMIDNYFSMYGYKVNDVKVPNITGRSNWNYVRTKGCNIVANIPQEDLDEIKAMFDSGITIWHKTAYFLDYSQNNPIV